MRAIFIQRGFTLIELVITICIVGILLEIAVPYFNSLIQNNASITLSNDLVTSLQFARSEAVKRDTNVSVCATSSSSFTACGTSWNLGWLIFVDTNGNGVYNSGTDTLLRTIALTSTNGVVSSSPSVNAAVYNSSGFAAAGTSNVTFTVYATGCKGPYARTIAISITGRILVTQTTCP